MKFAKELENELVPEWRAKYLDYKLGKKKLKAVARALRTVNQTPRNILNRRPNTFTPSPFETAPKYSFINRAYPDQRATPNGGPAQDLRKSLAISRSRSFRGVTGHDGSIEPSEIPSGANPEELPLRGANTDDARPDRMTRYGSIIGSPPSNKSTQTYNGGRKPPTLELPDPALDPDESSSIIRSGRPAFPANGKSRSGVSDSSTNAFEVGKTKQPPSGSKNNNTLPAKYRSIFKPQRVNSMPPVEGPRPFMKRIMSLGGTRSPGIPRDTDVPLEAYREVDIRQAEFFNFLDLELEKIEGFYKHKEEEATERLKILREQLHFMRDRRLEELISTQTAKFKPKRHPGGPAEYEDGPSDDETGEGPSRYPNIGWLRPLDGALEAAKEAAKQGRFGKNTKAMGELGTPTALRPQRLDARRDYSRRPEPSEVPYRTAKRKLKVALQEYYRGLELLKSYALLNRKAFLKINKKYDKTVNARPSNRYMTEKVNKSWFNQSEVIDGHIRVVEDLYARYFEGGNHKVAVGKLRVKTSRAGDYTGSVFRNGLMTATGIIFGIEGIIRGAELESSPNRTLATRTSYLLQVYAGYFLMLLLMLFFSLDCRVMSHAKINYSFVFEFDTRSVLDWRELSELPCFFLMLNGIFIWLNFNEFGSSALYTYYPVILISISIIVILLPVRILYHKSRQWLLYSGWRLLLAGLYPVEFRDFFLGDMFCSLTYTMGNIELFFCLYARGWNQPVQCNSNHSRLLGFLACLPGIWRALQCIRRYVDTRNVFPHLVNCGKYSFTILFYMSLSLYRINKTSSLKALFIFFGTVNSIYCSIWDLVMDWSLGDPYAKYPFLRETLGYKRVWWYYAAMIIDPILRFNWIFYAIYARDLQHSALLSFLVSLSEVFRRGMWSLFRIENEHCTNVGRFRASRDVPLPYEIDSEEESQEALAPSLTDTQRDATPGLHHTSTRARATGVDVEEGRAGDSQSSTRRRMSFYGSSPMFRGLSRVGNILHTAHAQDFERKRKPELSGGKGSIEDEADASSDEEDGEDAGTANVHDERDEEQVALAEGLLDEEEGGTPDSPRGDH
ncbi:EXS-domain-containing protein [Patellaria atrata CBS 101060]|uniref:EXS-domain-containing protein n=1 Tax=Patellaria atrata CBS 101060 TaxID=1346257 RepID=A0A9P4SEF8_9PEZI|nr:EXS-domain-containing protein [Patellaria atrata CBS 101060]